MFDKPKSSLICRNAGLMATAGWLIASFAVAQTRLPRPDQLPSTIVRPTVKVSPPEITGGTGPINVVVPLPAPSTAAVTVTLTSSLPAVTYVPSTVFVPAGASSFSYTVRTVPVATDTSVQISARVFNVAIPGSVATLRVLAPVLVSLVLSPTSKTGGAPLTKSSTQDSCVGNLPYEPICMFTYSLSGMVRLSGFAPAGGLGFSVVLASSNPAATVPSSVVIPANWIRFNFPITTTAVSAPTVAQISARLGTIVKSAPLEILPK
jgi:trimeric autotransporter adhesin